MVAELNLMALKTGSMHGDFLLVLYKIEGPILIAFLIINLD